MNLTDKIRTPILELTPVFLRTLGDETDVVQKFNSERYFTPVFLSGDDLQDDLDATWTAIEPVAKLAAQK